MEKQDFAPERGITKDQKLHPVCMEFGSNALIVHTMIEDIFQNTFYHQSVTRNPTLKLLKPEAPGSQMIKIYILDDLEAILLSLVGSEEYYPGADKLLFLAGVYSRMGTNDQFQLIAPERAQKIRGSVLNCLLRYLLKPSTYSPGAYEENPRDPNDFSCSLYDAFYQKLASVHIDSFFKDFLANIPEQYLDPILTPLFKRIVRTCAEDNLDNSLKRKQAIRLLQDLLESDPRIPNFFFQHELYIPKSSQPTGREYQKYTIFGAILSPTSMCDESQSILKYIKDPGFFINPKAINTQVQTKIHDSIDSLHRLIEGLIKMNPTNKKLIIDWIYGVVLANNAMQTETNPNLKFSSHGWFTNFLVLLLKLCQKMLSDPASYPTWLPKIDLTYIYERSIFSGIKLLSGKTVDSNNIDLLNMGNISIQPANSNSGSKFSFLTELIFLTTHTFSLYKYTINVFSSLMQQLQALHSSSEVPSVDPIELSNKFGSYAIQILDPYLTKQLHKLLNFEVLLILHSYGIAIKSLADLPTIFEQIETLRPEGAEERGLVPYYWAKNVMTYLQIFSLLDRRAFATSYENLDILMDFSVAVIKNPHWIDNISLRLMAYSFLHTLLPNPEAAKAGQKDMDFTVLFKKNQYIERNLIGGLFELFVDMQQIDPSETRPYEKYEGRRNLFELFNYLLNSVFPNDNTSCVLKNLEIILYKYQKIHCRFVAAIIEDFTYLVDDVFSKLREMQRYKENFREILALPYPERSKMMADQEIYKQNVPIILSILKQYYETVINISKNCPQFFLSEEISEEFAASLGHNLKMYTQDGALDLEVPEVKLVGSTPEFLLESLVQIYLNLFEKEGFVKSVMKDQKNYSSQMFFEALGVLEARELLMHNDHEKFVQFLSCLE